MVERFNATMTDAANRIVEIGEASTTELSLWVGLASDQRMLLTAEGVDELIEVLQRWRRPKEAVSHKMVVVGVIGLRRAYLDVPRDEAVRRYCRYYAEREDLPVDEFEFTDEFGAYDVWGP